MKKDEAHAFTKSCSSEICTVKELVPLQEVVEHELRHGLLSSDALANLPNISEIGTVKKQMSLTIPIEASSFS